MGGARWLIVPALVIVLPLAMVAAADIDVEGGVGDREYRPATMAEVRDPYGMGMGDIDVDLTVHATSPPAGPTSRSTSGSARRSSTCPTTRA